MTSLVGLGAKETVKTVRASKALHAEQEWGWQDEQVRMLERSDESGTDAELHKIENSQSGLRVLESKLLEHEKKN